MTYLTDFLATHQLLTIMLVITTGALLGQIKFGPLRFGAAGALFMGLVVGSLDPRIGIKLDVVKGLGIVLFCYTVGLTAGSTFLSDLKRQWKLMVAAVVALLIMAVSQTGLGHLCGLRAAHNAGAYAGVLTSPAIDAAIAATHADPDVYVGYAMAYPTGVILGMLMLAVLLSRSWPGTRDNPSLADIGIVARTCRVEHDTRLSDVPGWADQSIRMSYLQHRHEVRVIRPDDLLRIGDMVLIIGLPDAVNETIDFLGHVSSHNLTHHRGDVDFRRFLVSNPRLIGRTISELNIDGRLNGVITRVRRADLDLLAADDLVLQPGDRVLAVVPRHRMQDAADFFGDSERHISQIDALTLGLGIALGLLLGLVSVPLGPHLRFSLGAAAGPLIVGMILGSLQKTGPFRWHLPHAANATMRQWGLMIFLACVGLATGPAFLAQAFTLTGLTIVVVSSVSLVIGGVVLIASAHYAGLSVQRCAGALAGFIGQPALLGFANSRVNDERIDSAYGALFALGTIIKILCVQIIVLL
ncbi:MAG: aspartate:alanine exchanger family transporter [Propionibacteriaceae bacterium]